MSEKKMNYREAFSWLNQIGVKATLFNRDRHTNEALKKANEVNEKIKNSVFHLLEYAIFLTTY